MDIEKYFWKEKLKISQENLSKIESHSSESQNDY